MTSWRRKNKWAPYRSGLEKDIAEDLKQRGIRFEYESQHLQYRKRVNSGECDACGHNKVSQRRNYTPDFEIFLNSGGSLLIESKGNFTQSDRSKMLAVKKANPTLDIRFIFAANNKLQKAKDDRYSDWADKHGFLYEIGRAVPEAWLQPTSGVIREPHAARSSPIRVGRKHPKRKATRKS